MLGLGTIPQGCTSNGRMCAAAVYGFRKRWLLRTVTNTHSAGCRMFRYMDDSLYNILLYYITNHPG